MMPEQTTSQEDEPHQRISDVTAIVLCGGQGRRAGGIDKPLAQRNEAIGRQRLIDEVMYRLNTQVNRSIISANRNQGTYAEINGVDQVIADTESGYLGPLYGVASCLPLCRTNWFLVCPGDTPKVPTTLVERLWPARQEASTAVVFDSAQQQHLHFLAHRSILEQLQTYLASGQRSARGFHAAVGASQVHIDDPAAFANENYQ